MLIVEGEREAELVEVYSSILKYCDPTDSKVGTIFLVYFAIDIN